MTITAKRMDLTSKRMRVAVALLLVGTFLAGCQVPPGQDADDFQRTCPAWFAAPDKAKYGSNIVFLHDAHSQNQEVREKKEDRTRWVVHPGVEGGHFWRNGTTDYYIVDIQVFVEDENRTRRSGVHDALAWAEAYRADPKENATAKTEDGDVLPPTGGRLLFVDMSDPRNPRTLSQVVVREGEILDKQYKIALTNGQGPADPWSLRIDWFFEGDKDKDKDTPSVLAGVHMQAERWYRHNDCIP